MAKIVFVAVVFDFRLERIKMSNAELVTCPDCAEGKITAGCAIDKPLISVDCARCKGTGRVSLPTIELPFSLDDIQNRASNAELPDERDNGTKCQRCGSRYKIDVMVSDELWTVIHGAENLLCGPCVIGSIELIADLLPIGKHIELLRADLVSSAAAHGWSTQLPTAGFYWMRKDEFIDFVEVDNTGWLRGFKVSDRAQRFAEAGWEWQGPITPSAPAPSEDGAVAAAREIEAWAFQGKHEAAMESRRAKIAAIISKHCSLATSTEKDK